MQQYALLDKINSPQDVKRLDARQLPVLAGEIRHKLITTVSRTGGHLASNLGVVELTIALHRVFSCPKDRIVFDVGHQCYTHKLLTGRRERFSTLRQSGGLSGFPKRGESEYDAFIAGHSSTSISAAIGLARAKRLRGEEGKAIAVIGDGAFAGVAFEALSNVDETLSNLVVILNDNEMSISKNVSAFAHHLAKIRNTKGYFELKSGVERTLGAIPLVGRGMVGGLSAIKGAAKNMLYNSNLFEDMGFTYLGPVEGHNLPQLCAVFERARQMDEPVLIHVHTQKGKGYKQAEENPGAFHGVSKFDPRKEQQNDMPADSFSEQMGLYLTELGERDSRIVAITAAMKYATGLHHFSTRFRDEGRFYDVGIAESHAVIFGAALGVGGMLPFFAVYSSFLQRAYDQLLHDCCLERVHLVLGVDRAGLVGEDGETHQGLFDVPFLCSLPSCAIYSPATYDGLRRCISRALYEEEGLCAVRYPRGRQTLVLPDNAKDCGDYYEIPPKGEEQGLLITYGRVAANALGALGIAGRAYRVLLLVKIWPLPREVLDSARAAGKIVMIEESAASGSLGEHLLAALAKTGWKGDFCHRAIENPVVAQGTVEQCMQAVGLDGETLAKIL